MKDLLYYRLPDNQRDRLAPLYFAAFPTATALPNPLFSAVWVAEDPTTNEVVGMRFLQFQHHGEPFCCIPGRGVSFTCMGSLIDAELASLGGGVYYTLVPNEPRALDAARRDGAVPVDLIPHMKTVAGRTG